jgi:eukaryotic-like serine/threonine-protein kinase
VPTLPRWLAVLLDPTAGRPPAAGESSERRVGEDIDLNEVMLGGRYRLENLIGRGASSIVYRAHDTVLGHDVAIKVLRRDGILSQERARSLAVSLRNETRLAMLLSHPNVLRVHHYEQSGQTEYVVMELAAGENLHQLVQRRVEPILSTREVVVFGLAVLFALEHAHGHGVIHNDLKPANILLCRPGGIKVCDFGLAQLSGAQAVSTTVAGTPAFMSPERIRGAPGDARSDLYSMAATFFTLASGRTPFGDKKEAIQGHLEAPTPTSPLVPEPLQGVIARAMEKRPADRFQSARAMVLAWEGMAAALSVAAPLTPAAGGMAVDPDGLPTEPSIDMPPRVARDEPSSLVRRVVGPQERPPPPSSSSNLPLSSEGPLTLSSEGPTARDEVPPLSSSIFRAQQGPGDRFLTTPSSADAAERRPATGALSPPQPEPIRRFVDAADLVEVPGGTVQGAEGAVAVRSFRLERTPVTNEAFARYLVATGAAPPTAWKGPKVPRGRERHPVSGVTLEQARAYARWSGRRLPTDAEWVLGYAGAEGRRFPWGDDWRPDACVGAHNARGETEAVGHRAGATPEGCTDLLGNVWEWTEHDPRFEAPEVGKAWVFGGAFRHRCDGVGPPRTAVDADNDYDYLGFRCAVDE